MVRLKSDETALDRMGAASIADRESRTPIRPDQPARLASTTKTYVAAASSPASVPATRSSASSVLGLTVGGYVPALGLSFGAAVSTLDTEA